MLGVRGDKEGVSKADFAEQMERDPNSSEMNIKLFSRLI